MTQIVQGAPNRYLTLQDFVNPLPEREEIVFKAINQLNRYTRTQKVNVICFIALAALSYYTASILLAIGAGIFIVRIVNFMNKTNSLAKNLEIAINKLELPVHLDHSTGSYQIKLINPSYQ